MTWKGSQKERKKERRKKGRASYLDSLLAS